MLGPQQHRDRSHFLAWPPHFALLTVAAEFKGLVGRWSDHSEAEPPGGMRKYTALGPPVGLFLGPVLRRRLALLTSSQAADAGVHGPHSEDTEAQRGLVHCWLLGPGGWWARKVSVMAWTVLQPSTKESAHFGLKYCLSQGVHVCVLCDRVGT